uniref:Ig-like domain-containing protein n=1 Tax=Leptobrachium leishanense TaxID=445787 RepID=A0A8C5PRC5_9ANUR
MKNLILTILFISSFYLSLCQGVLVKQTQKFLLVNPGESVTMDCYQDDASYFNMYWYQQKPGEGLKLMIYSVASGENQNMEPDFQSAWKLERKDIHNSVLNLSSASIDDSAVYYCAASFHRDKTQGSSWHKIHQPKNNTQTFFLPDLQGAPYHCLQHLQQFLYCYLKGRYHKIKIQCP